MSDYMEKFRLDKKTAFVIGGLGLIGKEVSIAFAEAGAKTIVIDLDIDKGHSFEKKMNKKGYDVLFNYFDCADMEKLDNNLSALLNKNSCPDIFINCSYPKTLDWEKNTFRDVTFSSFTDNVNIQMNSHAWLSRLVAEAMTERGTNGSIIQLGSTYGIVGQDLTVYEGTEMNENMTYAAIKGGITNLTRLMASYYGQYNIRINTLCPGGLEGHVAGKSNTQNQIFVEQYSKKTPLKRLGRAEEVASTALFLASDAASYITGATIMVDGGWTSI
jgi:NAD(P)-dependent dehydrogenase (short-subunit alcohol dehydrogenase family)